MIPGSDSAHMFSCFIRLHSGSAFVAISVTLVIGVLLSGAPATAGSVNKWTNADSHNNKWGNGDNWSNGIPIEGEDGAKVVVNKSGGEKAVIQQKQWTEESWDNGTPGVRVGTNGKTGELDIRADVKFASSPDTSRVIIGDSGGKGRINQMGGTAYSPLSGLVLGSSAGSYGEYNLSGGSVNINRGGVDIGRDGGSGLMNVTGGTLKLRNGVNLLSSDSTFRVGGSGAKVIHLNYWNDQSSGWKQPEGTLKADIGEGGLSTIEVSAGSDGKGGNVTFGPEARLDVGFMKGSSERAGCWEVMRWEGELTDRGLSFAADVDTDRWRFRFKDTDSSGSPDTLCVCRLNTRSGANWIGAGENHLWQNPDNWQTGAVPETEETTHINLAGPARAVIDDERELNRLVVGWGSEGRLDITDDADVELSEGQAVLGKDAGSQGRMVLKEGTLALSNQSGLHLGRGGTGILELNDGRLEVAGGSGMVVGASGKGASRLTMSGGS